MFALSKLSSVVSSSFSALPRTASLGTKFFFSTQGGSVKWFDAKKGFGFITPDDGSADIFVHQSVVYAEGFRSLADGEPVEFTVTADPSGRLRADRVTGPQGTYVQGAPRRPQGGYDDNQGGFGGNSGGFGGNSGGFGGGNQY